MFARYFMVLLAALGFFAKAQDKTLVIKNVGVFDGEQTVVVPNRTLLIRGEKVVSIAGPETKIPKDTVVIDGEGMTVMPGLIDLHTHLMVPGSFRHTFVMRPFQENLRSHLWSGVTTVADLFTTSWFIDQIEANKETGRWPDIVWAGPLFTAPGGHGTQFGVPAAVINEKGDIEKLWQQHLALKPGITKAVLEHGGWGGLPKMNTLDEEIIAELGRRSRNAGLPFFVHIWTLKEAKAAVRAGADALVHGVYSGPIDDELIALMKKHGTAYVPTLSVALNVAKANEDPAWLERFPVSKILNPELYESLMDPENIKKAQSGPLAVISAQRDVYYENLKRIADAGIAVGIGSDAGNPFALHGPAVHHEIDHFLDAGLSLPRVMIAATSGSADILGVGAEVGRIRKGYLANLILVKGDPLKDPGAHHRVEQVIHRGILVSRVVLAELNQKMDSPAITKSGEPFSEPLIDDFEDQDNVSSIGAEWKAWDDRIAGGKSKAEITVKPGGSGNVLHLEGTISEGFQYGPWSGVRLDFKPRDAGSFDGLTLKVRGKKRRYTLTVGNAVVEDFNIFFKELEVEPEWREVRIPFSSLRQLGFGKSVDWTSETVTGFVIDARETMGGQPDLGNYWLEVDEVQFYK